MKTCYIASSYASCSVDEIAAAAPAALRWFQLYIHRDRTVSEQLVRRAEAAGFRALVLTADVPYTGKRRDDIRNNFRFLSAVKPKNFEGAFEGKDCSEYGVPAGSIDPSVTWNDISWLRRVTRLPLIIKGILTKEDAELAMSRGVQGIIVSNHGGRQLDGAPASIDALVEIVATVENKIDVYLDGGIRTGSDVLKALALGAKCVFIGRPAIWGLAYKGEEGLRKVLEILKEEFRLSMALAGKSSPFSHPFSNTLPCGALPQPPLISPLLGHPLGSYCCCPWSLSCPLCPKERCLLTLSHRGLGLVCPFPTARAGGLAGWAPLPACFLTPRSLQLLATSTP
ncbi:hydroxyacid oxidase 2 [Podarcis lilfordi]|uniref:(S)-2-hydroxy-acid oxidase n=1 Tax=Podarcis lilfordi TaxID=74358 RepID=A0AA35PT79_9SAUR|nr:hydroxyacid oxidase 2 [Podarcis lilfordi]